MVDQWGIPVLKFHFQWTDAELNQVQHMEQTFTSIIETMGGKVTAIDAADGAEDFDRRRDYSRSRLDPHGRRSENVGAE